MNLFLRPVLFLAYILVLFSPALASDEPSSGPSNWGGTGLMEVPTARIMKKNTFRLGASQIEPYRYYYGTISPAEGLEIGGRITQILGVAGFNPGDAYGDYKDKALDFKYQLFQEYKYTPAFSIGIMDPHGTRVYASQYLAFSKQIYPFDFSIGYGNGRFGKKPLAGAGELWKLEILKDPKTWIKDSQYFGGITFSPSEKYALMAEYSPVQYSKQTQDPAQKKYFNSPVPSHYNFGFRWKPVKEAEIGLSYQRGNTIGANFSIPFEIGKPLIPMFNTEYIEAKDHKAGNWMDRIEVALLRSGVGDLGIKVEGKELYISMSNYTYFYNVKALLIALRTIGPMIPEDIEDVIIIFNDNDIPLFSFHTKRFDIIDYRDGRLSVAEFFRLSRFETEHLSIPKFKRTIKESNLAFGYKPHFSLYLNDPTGFFKGMLGALGWAGYKPWAGGMIVGGVGIFPLSSVSTQNQPLSNPVRSDYVKYMDTVVFDKFLFQQMNSFGPQIFTKATLGILEIEYAGLDLEIAKPFFDGRLLAGLSGSIVKKRDPDNPLQLKKNDPKDRYTTSFINTKINFPESESSLDIKYGKFLAGDVGARFTVSKSINGVICSVFYSFTDTSVFPKEDTVNRGYHDKGFEIKIPLRFLAGKDTKTVFPHRISPWTRDVAQDIDHFSPLFDFIDRNTKVFLNKDANKDILYK